MFNVGRSAIVKHINNIYNDAELEKNSTCSILEQVQLEGNIKVTRKREYYNLDMIISIGFRVNSKIAIKFRTWANKLKKEGNESVTNCNQLKLKAADGKYYNTDVVDIEGMFRIIESIPSKNAEPIKRWLAKLGSERIDEIFDPSIATQRSIDLYRAKGFDEEWISKRIKGIQDRKKLTDVWKDSGIESNLDYEILTNEIYKEWSGMTAKQYKNYKGLRKESLRDNMSDLEVALADLGEIATREISKKQKPYGLEQNKKVARLGGHAAKVAKDDIEKNLGENIVTKNNRLNYEYKDEKLIDMK